MLPVLLYASDNKGMLTGPSSDLFEEALLMTADCLKQDSQTAAP